MKRIISVMIIIGMVFVGYIVPVNAITANELSSKIESLKYQYPNGTHQSAFYNSVYSGDGTACYKDLSGWSSWQCMAWACKVYDTLWGNSVRNGSFHQNAYSLYIGDYARFRSTGVDHSIVITNIVGDTIYYTDCNGYSSANKIQWDRTMSKSDLQTKINQALYKTQFGWDYGHIVHYPENNISNGVSPVDLGTDFYATINHVTNGHAVGIESTGSLELVDKKVTEKNRWHFMRQSDGSYIIYLNVGSQVMDVTNAGTTDGTKVGVSNVNYGTAQKWYIYKQDNTYYFKTQSSNMVLDVGYNHGEIGDWVQMWTPNQSQAQYFTINKVIPFNDWVYIHNESQTPVLYSDEDVIFTYDAVTSYFYDLWLYQDGVRLGQLYAGSSKTYRQRYDAGEYELLFASQNEVGWNYGRFHPFKVVDRTRTVSFDANGGTTNQTAKTLQYNAAYGELLPAVREGYTFKGWYTLSEGGTQINAESLCDSVSNITLYAQWEEIIPHTVSTVIKNGLDYTINTELYELPSSCMTTVAGYKNNQLVSVNFADSNICTLNGDVDEIKVMVWDSLTTLKPLCQAEDITSDKFVIE